MLLESARGNLVLRQAVTMNGIEDDRRKKRDGIRRANNVEYI